MAAAAVALDQASKTWALDALADGPIELALGVRLALTFNSGAAFSIGSGRPEFFAVAAVVTIAVLAFVVVRSSLDRTRAVAFGLILGGALGNVIDRVGPESRREGRRLHRLRVVAGLQPRRHLVVPRRGPDAPGLVASGRS